MNLKNLQNTMVQAIKINKSYQTLNVLKNVDLNVNKGEIVSVVGPSGAGKTSLLQIIGTLMPADSGDIKINGISVNTLNSKQISKFRNHHIGFIFQFHHLLPEFTALENVCLPAYIKGLNKKETIAHAKDLLNFLNLSERIHHKPAELSGGEQQRVAVARALINNPSVVLADEPSGNLDTVNKEALHNLFFSLRDTYKHTFIIVTHDNKLAEMSDRVIKLIDGKIA